MQSTKFKDNILTERCLEYLTLSGLGFSNEEVNDILNILNKHPNAGILLEQKILEKERMQ